MGKIQFTLNVQYKGQLSEVAIVLRAKMSIL